MCRDHPVPSYCLVIIPQNCIGHCLADNLHTFLGMGPAMGSPLLVLGAPMHVSACVNTHTHACGHRAIR